MSNFERETAMKNLWCDTILQADSLSDRGLMELLSVSTTHRLFQSMDEDALVSALSSTKSLLNEPKTREIGIQVLENILAGISVDKLKTIQKPFLSALRLACTERTLHLAITKTFLVTLIPMLKQLPDVVKEFTQKNSFLTKILNNITEELKNAIARRQLPSREYTLLLELCIKYFPGPCHSYKEKLHKIMLQYLESEKMELICFGAKFITKLCATGGTGSKGDNHSIAWSNSMNVFIAALYDDVFCLYSMVSNLFNEENPYKSKTCAPMFPVITDESMTNRMVKLKWRILGLLKTIEEHMICGLGSPKPVPVSSLLSVINMCLALNTSNASCSVNFETTFLNVMLPTIHCSALSVLSSLFKCLRSNVLPYATQVEQLLLQEGQWVLNMSTSCYVYENVWESLLVVLRKWLLLTSGRVSTSDTFKRWLRILYSCVTISKQGVCLTSGTNISGNSSSSQLQYRIPSSKVCSLALNVIQECVQGMNSTEYLICFQVVVKTLAAVYQSNTCPVPYDQAKCRYSLFQVLLQLIINVKGPCSLSLAIHVMNLGAHDPVRFVATYCKLCLEYLEKIIHPSKQSMEFAYKHINKEDLITGVDELCNHRENIALVSTSSKEIQTVELLSHVQKSIPMLSKPESPTQSLMLKKAEEQMNPGISEKLDSISELLNRFINQVPKNFARLSSSQKANNSSEEIDFLGEPSGSCGLELFSSSSSKPLNGVTTSSSVPQILSSSEEAEINNGDDEDMETKSDSDLQNMCGDFVDESI